MWARIHGNNKKKSWLCSVLKDGIFHIALVLQPRSLVEHGVLLCDTPVFFHRAWALSLITLFIFYLHTYWSRSTSDYHHCTLLVLLSFFPLHPPPSSVAVCHRRRLLSNRFWGCQSIRGYHRQGHASSSCDSSFSSSTLHIFGFLFFFQFTASK